MKSRILTLTVMAAALAVGSATLRAAEGGQAPNPAPPKPTEVVINGVKGYQDTPMEPDAPWHVHDPARPQPPVVTPGAQPAQPPGDAIVLFNGRDLSQWRDQKGNPAPWILENGAMTAAKAGIVSTQAFGDVQLHAEFCEPPPKGDGQGRGNSGIFLMDKYEVQVLDCFSNLTYADGMTGALYGEHPPLVNACRPPGEWQTYDIIFTAPRFDAAGGLIAPARATILLNGVLVQNHQAYRGPTVHRQPGNYAPHGPTGPISLQFHGNPVRFRNIWVRPLKGETAP